MILRGKLFAESPVYRGNARKTLFTRDGDGTHRLASLAGEVSGTAQSLMDAFIGRSRRGRNIGLLNRLWRRLYGASMPDRLIGRVDCKLQEESYPPSKFFDLRMGIKLDEDRWAAEANANYKMETLFRHSTFDFEMTVDDSTLRQGENQARLYYLLQELREGRFWFGAGKSKGLGRFHLDIDLPFSPPETVPGVSAGANHLSVTLRFNATNPVLVGWPWGKVEPDVPSFAAIEGRLLVGAMRGLPDPIRQRLEIALGGPILSPKDWKRKLAEQLPRVIAIWLMKRSLGKVEVWTLPASGLKKLRKGRYPLAKKIVNRVKPLIDRPFSSREEAEAVLVETLRDKANMADRILDVMEHERRESRQLDRQAWQEVASSLGLDPDLAPRLDEQIEDERALVGLLAPACQKILPGFYRQVDQHIHLLQSDAWIDAEITAREGHLKIKTMLLEGKITEGQWGDRNQVPEGVSPAAWYEFLDDHRRVRYRYMTNRRNLRKSIVNDENFVAFLKTHRDRARQELAQPYHVDFRAGGPSNREVSRKYGKSYDTVFMRMLSWASSSQEEGAWEIYIPGSTIKGAFRKRASQVVKTLWGESTRTTEVLENLFGAQGQIGLVFFSDAYLADPHDPERGWCSMDGVKMDPHTGQPLETAKHDYLFAYGSDLVFRLRLDVQDVGPEDMEALLLLRYLLQDFQRGDIPLGGEKTSGFGWVKAAITRLDWRTAGPDGLGRELFGEQTSTQDGIWQRWLLEGEAAASALEPTGPLVSADREIADTPPQARAGFISHRAFGGYCGMLFVEAQALTPIHVRESGEPSFKTVLADGPVNGWDFFSMSPPEADQRPAQRVYALPSRSIKGMLRHMYAIASDSRGPSTDIGHLNPADGLFGWVGQGPNQALMGRLSFGFGLFKEPELAWFKVPYPYGEWQYSGGQWRREVGSSATKARIANTWRVFPHAPLAPVAGQLDDFQPDTVQASYFRAVLPGSQAHFTVRFWNLEKEELQRLIWCVALEPELAHKMGKNRYLGFGGLRLRVLPESYLIDWASRYAGEPEAQWRLPFQVEEWHEPAVVRHYSHLKRSLNAERV